MSKTRFPAFALSSLLAAACFGAACLPAAAANKANPVAAALLAMDTDKSGTLDWAEVSRAAELKFNIIEKDKDGTLDKKEIKGLGIDLKAADPDKDGTLDKAEYMAVAERLFKEADADHDGALSVAELKTTAGKKLLRLLFR